jgi:DNA repair protein RadC
MYEIYNPIKTWAEDDRPREKLLSKCKGTLSDAELIAILIGSGTRKKSALELAKEILLASNNDLSEFSKNTSMSLCAFNGIGAAKAVTILAALELGRRRNEFVIKDKMRLVSPELVYTYLKSIYQDLSHEEFHILLLTKNNHLIKSSQISKGGMSNTVVDSRIIFKEAIENKASGIILTHNHPSNTLRPSKQDEAITKRLVQAGELLSIPILDHIIYTENGFFSFAYEGIL